MTNKRTICVLIGDISHDYTNELMRGMNEAAAQHGIGLFYMSGKQKHIASIDSDKEQEAIGYYNSIYDYAELIGADAFIVSCGSLSGFTEDSHYLDFMERFIGKKHVVLHQIMDEAPGRAVILVDNYSSVCQLTEHLIIDHKHKNIAFISGPPGHPDGSIRERAYLDTMKKHGLPVESGMVCHGDLSGFVSAEVNKLLDDYPNLEAIMLCNDEMARTAYRVLSERGLTPGKDIAVTGFDDFTTGRTLSPPLTTISQSAMQSGYIAVLTAAELIEGRPSSVTSMQTKVRVRASCGCVLKPEGSIFSCQSHGEDDYVRQVAAHLHDDLTHLFAQDGNTGLSDLIGHIASYAASAALDPKDAAGESAEISALFDSRMDQYGSIVAQIADRLQKHLLQAARMELCSAGLKLSRILLGMIGALYSHEVRESARRFNTIRTQAWFAQEFIRDLVITEDEEDLVFRRAVDRLRHIGLEKVHICLLPVPRRANRHILSYESSGLLLAAYQDGDASIAFPRSRMPVYNHEFPLTGLPGLDGSELLITFGIFSGDVQYGVLLCSADERTLPILHIIGLQLGMLANFLDLKSKERIVLSELENTRERMEVLSFLSEYDPLCNVYNRRGFIEQAIRLNRENEGKRAICAFIDLDNLKIINDTFGHTAGDEAIISASSILKHAIRDKDLVARVGGDEFILLLLVDHAEFETSFPSRLNSLFSRYNQTSDKPYNLTVSVGLTSFTCRPGLEISKVIDQADKMLYVEKKHKNSKYKKA